MSTLWITRGISGSGKTTYARNMVDSNPVGEVIRLNRDDIRAMALPSTYREPVYWAEELVTKIQHSQITEFLRQGIDVVVDDTNLKSKVVKEFIRLAVKAKADWECVDFFDVPLEECIRRNATRENPIPEEVIRKQWTKFFSGGRTLPVPTLEEETVSGALYVPPLGGRAATIVDLDGTVALCGDRDIYDGSKAHLDIPNRPVVDSVVRDYLHGFFIIFCSGRDEQFRDVSEEWISKHVISRSSGGWKLLMRPKGDRRKDSVVKMELFDTHIRNTYNISHVWDDRQQVVDAYRGIGLTVYQVAPGQF